MLLAAGLAWGYVLPLSSLALVALAWVRVKDRDDEERVYARRLALGMTAGFAGDLCMGAGVVLGGLLFFGIGHGCYIRAMLARARAWQLGGRGRRLALWGLWLVVGSSIWYGVAATGGMADGPPKLRVLARALAVYDPARVHGSASPQGWRPWTGAILVWRSVARCFSRAMR